MISWLSNLRLSLTQWLLASTVLLCGVLVAALRLQGSRLHKAQIEALSARIDLTNANEEAKIEVLRNKMDAEIYKYEQSH